MAGSLHRCGGKVNAAVELSKALSEAKIQTIINYGSAGSLRPDLSGIHEVTRFFNEIWTPAQLVLN